MSFKKMNPAQQALQFSRFMSRLERVLEYCLKHQEELEKRVSALDGKTSEIPVPDLESPEA